MKKKLVKRNTDAPKVNRTRAVRPAIKGLNVKLLRRVQKHILQEPNRLVMSLLAIKQGEPIPRDASDVPVTFAACGTAACIAGWSLIISGEKPFTELEQGDGAERASELLSLDSNDEPSTCLFHLSSWPEPFAYQYARADTQRERAQITSDRIDYFIKEGK